MMSILKLGAVKDENMINFDDFNCFAQTLFIAQFVSKLLNNTGLTCSLIDKFIEFLLFSKNNVKKFRINQL